MKQKKKKSQYVVSGLIDFLEEVGEDSLLPDIVDTLKAQAGDKKISKAKVISAIGLTTQQKEALRDALFNLFKLNLPIVNIVDKKIIGGFTVYVGDWQLDASILQELRRIKNKLLS